MRAAGPLLLFTSLFSFGTASAEPRWLRANFHAHATGEQLNDDGAERSEALHRALGAHGFDYSMHSAHSTMNSDGKAFSAQREQERRYAIPGLLVGVGEELTVADGPNYQAKFELLGRRVPGNYNHVTLAGLDVFLPTHTPLAVACARAHASGGICLVNHPGPGPMMWEAGLWESPENRGVIDGIEVYNGQAIASVGIDFASRYLEATACGALGMHVAAVSGTDTHGPASVARARGHLRGALTKLGLLVPPAASNRPELDAVTWVLAEAPTERSVLEGVKERRTIATYALPDVRFECAHLGEVVKARAASLHLATSRPLAEITLYREGQPIKTWHDARDVTWTETITGPTAFVWTGHDTSGRFMSSAIWYEP